MYQPANIKLKKIDCLDDLKFQGMHLHKHAFTEILTAATLTLDANDNGKVILCEVTTVITLPAIGSGEVGPYTLVNYGEEGVVTAGISDVQITVDPATADRITGCDITGLENKDMVNTLATAKKGDLLKLTYGGGIGWSIVEMRGTWTRET